MRLFVAVNFGPDTRARLLALQEELRQRAEGGRFPPEENLHLTLAFLGECDETREAAAKSALDRLRFAPLKLSVDRVGRFARPGGEIWWAGLAPSPPLQTLQGSLVRLLGQEGFSLEPRPFSPHITLGREVRTQTLPWRTEAFGEMADAVWLMRSERLGGRMVYTPAHRRGATDGPEGG